MNCVTPLLDFILNLLRDSHKQAEFHQHPERMLAEHGLHGVSAHDIHDMLPLVTDHPAVQLSAEHGFSSPPPIFPASGESETHCAIRMLEHITRVYNIDNHNTVIDDSVHENIWAPGGDVSQTFDDTSVVASGHAVAAGGGIWGSAVTTGNDNAIGTGNAVGVGNVTGSGNALGAGSVVGTGNAVANGYGSTIGSGNNVANGFGSAAGHDNSVINGSHDVLGNGNVTGHVIGSQVATTGGTIADGNHVVSDSGNTDLHSFGAGATNTIGSDNISATAINSGNSSESHTFSDVGNSTDTSLTSGSYDENGTHLDHGAVGDSYGINSLQGSCDSHDSGMELHIH